MRLPAVSPVWTRRLWLLLASLIAVVGFGVTSTLVLVRATHNGRVFPAVAVGDVPVGGMAFGDAAAAIGNRADAIESSTVTFGLGEKSWSRTLRDIGVSIDESAALSGAQSYGREVAAGDRLRATVRLLRSGGRVSMPIAIDYEQLDDWFDTIDRDLGTPPHNALVEIQGSSVAIVPEVDGTVVDRDEARAAIVASLTDLEPLTADLPISTKIATVRAADLEPVRSILQNAMSHPIQVTDGKGLWTLPPGDIAQFLKQDVATREDGAPTITLGLDQTQLATWLDERLGAQLETEPVDAVLGWNGERVVSVESSVDGVRLDASKLAELVEGRFFGDGGSIPAPVTYVEPTIDSNDLGALGITTLLGSGQSNYSGSSDGRATNVEVGAGLLNSTLVPPWGEFSFNGAIGWIDEEKGFVEAQVIDGEKIGKDIGGGICQVSTTMFRAAYLAGLPITEWWPHRFRIGFYEYDGWKPGLDASILQPTEDPATWADFKFENPSDSWMLIESWTDGINVIVNIYGADLGYQVDSTGPTWGEKSQMLSPQEVVDDELDPGTVTLTQVAGIGEELSHYRVVRDRNGALLWERSFYTKYFPRADIWKVSPDMKGQAPVDPNFKAPPLPPAGVDSQGWVPGAEASSEAWTTPAEAPPVEEWASTGEGWVPPAEELAPPADQWAPAADEWVAPAEGSATG